MFRTQVTVFQRADAAFGLTEVEEQLFLGRRGAKLHKAPGPQDVFLNRRTDPPHCVGRKAEALFRVETFHSLHQTHVGLGNHFGLRQAIAAIAHRDFRRQTQVACDQLVSRVSVLIFDPAFGQHVFLFRLKQRELANFLKVPAQAGFRGRRRKVFIITCHLHPS